MRKGKDLTGQQFGLLTAIARLPPHGKNGSYMWVCDCECGGTAIVYRMCRISSGISIKSENRGRSSRSRLLDCQALLGERHLHRSDEACCRLLLQCEKVYYPLG